jgi:hypothetical protein
LADRNLKNLEGSQTIPAEHPTKFEVMIDLTATMALPLQGRNFMPHVLPRRQTTSHGRRFG